VDAQTLEIRAIEVTDNAIGDSPMLPQLLAQIPEDELLCSVSADGAYDTKACHEAIAHRTASAGLDPQPIYLAGHTRDSARGVTPSGVRGTAT
jgi:hypothetical protein